jgi:hypothetical protein
LEQFVVQNGREVHVLGGALRDKLADEKEKRPALRNAGLFLMRFDPPQIRRCARR